MPIAVTALSANDLAGGNIEGQLTLPKLTPNLNFTVQGAAAAVFLRGVGTTLANPGLESSVSVYIDDTYIPRAASGLLAFGDIQRIEVLKGPQGTLYGRNATGGAIRIITNDPGRDVAASAAVTYGTENRLAFDDMANMPLPSRQIELGVGGGYLDSKYKDFVGDAYATCAEVPGLSANTPAEVAGKAAAVASCAGSGGLGLALVGGRTLTGNRLVNAPKFSGYGRVQFTQPVEGVGTFVLTSIVNHRSKAYFDPAKRFVDPRRTLLSANLTWTSESEIYFVTLMGENLTGKKFNTIVSSQNTGGWRVPGAPRQVYIRLGAKL